MAFFRDLLKKWFYTNSSSAASNDARIPLLTATGEPKGSDTMANIASVLGAVKTGTADANTIDNEWHMCSNNVSNVPTPYGLLYTKKYSDALFVQEYFSTVDKQSYTRTYYSGQWHDWTSLNSFGCSTPADLASALEESMYKGIGTSSYDYNSVSNVSLTAYYFITESPLEKEGFLEVVALNGSDLTNIQTFYAYDGTIIKRRMWNWSAREWTAWVSV